MEHKVKVIIDRFENDKAVLVTPFGQQIFWPREALPEEAEVGSIHSLGLDIPMQKPQQAPIQAISPEVNQSQDKNEIAITILEELLNAGEKQNEFDPSTQKKLL